MLWTRASGVSSVRVCPPCPGPCNSVHNSALLSLCGDAVVMQRVLARSVRLCCRRSCTARFSPAEPHAAPSKEDKERRLAANQLRTAGSLLAALAPHVRSDAALAQRVKALSGERQFNSSSRRLYRELLFAAVRHWGWVETLLSGPHGELGAAAAAAFLADDTPEVRRLRDANEASLVALGARSSRELAAARDALQLAYPAAALCTPEDLAAPAWFRAQCSAAELPPAEVALSRAPLYIRVQMPDAESELRAELAKLGVSVREVPQLLGAWELRCGRTWTDVDLTATDGYQAGVFEIQDLGSQTLLAVVTPEPGGKWLDACAGAGGKSLQLAALLGPNGRVTACDVREEALRELRRRARRARLENRIMTLQCDWASNGSGADGDLFDGVLVDAPCTGSGTWRRQPHLRWLLTPEAVAAAAQRQLQILHAAAKRIRPGGLLVYATCSLADAENGGVVDAFLRNAPFEAVPLPRASALGLSAPDGRLTISPALLNSDGFFVAAMRRSA